jgi:outer membrane immunogenic protein
MKVINLAVAAFALATGPALAADLPSRKAEPLLPPPPPAPMWTGFYAGLNAGYNFGTNSNAYSQNLGQPWFSKTTGELVFNNSTALSMDMAKPNNQSGFIGGGQIGYNYQWGNNFVVGFETDFQGTTTNGRSSGIGAAIAPVNSTNQGILDFSSSSLGGTTVQAGVNWLGTVRGRAGYLFMPTLLVYGTGGLTYGNVYANVHQTALETQGVNLAGDIGTVYANWYGQGQQSQTRTGWNAGGGFEWMFMPNWSVKGEALYWDLGRINVQTASLGLQQGGGELPNTGWGRTSVSYSGVIARAGINYHFNFGGSAPVIAKY